jgi:dTMP kinase
MSVYNNKNREIPGRLIIVEGVDGSGKSTQIRLLEKWFRYMGLPVFFTEWNSSETVKEITSKGKKKALLTPTTFSLLHATDFADRYERHILPLLRAGYIVLADRYIYTLLAREAVRGISRRWSHNLFSFAIVPDLVFYLDVTPEELVHRVFQKNAYLDYYESGADMGLADDMFESFMKYQAMIAKEFRNMQKRYNLVIIDGNRSIPETNADLQKRIDAFLESARPSRAL